MEVVSKEKCARSLMIVSLNACRTGDSTVTRVIATKNVAGKRVSVRGKECEKFFLQRVQIEGARCDTVLAESAEIHDTCIRPRGVFVAACSIWSHAHTCISSVHGSSRAAARGVGALLIHRPAWVDQHTSESRVDTHSTPVTERDGCGWPM